MSDALTTEDTTHINLTVEAIKYIFVNTVEDRNKLLQTIKNKFADNVENALILASKIVVYQETVGIGKMGFKEAFEEENEIELSVGPKSWQIYINKIAPKTHIMSMIKTHNNICSYQIIQKKKYLLN